MDITFLIGFWYGFYTVDWWRKFWVAFHNYNACIKFLEHRHLSLFNSALCFFTTNIHLPVSLTYPKNRIHKHHCIHTSFTLSKHLPFKKGRWRSSSIQLQVWVNTKLWSSLSLSVCFTAADYRLPPALQASQHSNNQLKKERARDAVSLFLTSFLSGLRKSPRHMQGCADAVWDEGGC